MTDKNKPSTAELRNSYIEFRKQHKKYMTSFIQLYLISHEAGLLDRDSLESFLAMAGALKLDDSPKLKVFLDKAAEHVKITQEAMEAWDAIQETPQAIATRVVLDRLETAAKLNQMQPEVVNQLLDEGHYIDDQIEIVLEDEVLKYRMIEEGEGSNVSTENEQEV